MGSSARRARRVRRGGGRLALKDPHGHQPADLGPRGLPSEGPPGPSKPRAVDRGSRRACAARPGTWPCSRTRRPEPHTWLPSSADPAPPAGRLTFHLKGRRRENWVWGPARWEAEDQGSGRARPSWPGASCPRSGVSWPHARGMPSSGGRTRRLTRQSRPPAGDQVQRTKTRRVFPPTRGAPAASPSCGAPAGRPWVPRAPQPGRHVTRPHPPSR